MSSWKRTLLVLVVLVPAFISGCVEPEAEALKDSCETKEEFSSAQERDRFLEANESFRQSKFQKYFWPREKMSYREKHAQMMLWEANKKCDQAVIREYGSMARYQDHLLDYQKRKDNEEEPFFRPLGRNHCPKCRKWMNGEGRIETR